MKRLKWIAMLMAFILLAVNVMSLMSVSAADTVAVRGTSGDVTGDSLICLLTFPEKLLYYFGK